MEVPPAEYGSYMGGSELGGALEREFQTEEGMHMARGDRGLLGRAGRWAPLTGRAGPGGAFRSARSLSLSRRQWRVSIN